MIPVGQDHPEHCTPVVCYTIVLACAAVFIHELTLPPAALESFIGHWALVPRRFWDWHGAPGAEPLLRVLSTLVSCAFLHGGWLHIIGNLWSLLIFGRSIEARFGHFRFLVFYLSCGCLSGICHVLLNLGSSVPTIGASGAIAGVMGAYFVLYPFTWIKVIVPIFFLPIVIKVPAVVYLLLWIVSQFAGAWGTMGNSAGAGGIAFIAHIGGFFSGIFLLRQWRRSSRGGGRVRTRGR